MYGRGIYEENPGILILAEGTVSIDYIRGKPFGLNATKLRTIIIIFRP